MNVQDFITGLAEQSPEQLLARASERLPFWISLLLVVMISWYLARLVWAVFPPPASLEWTPPPATGGAAVRNTGQPSTDYGALVAAHLFGEATADPEPVVEDVVDAPDTRLNLELRATVSAVDAQYAHAIIADGSKNEQVYFLRDSVPGGATLHQVHTDRVILNRGGVLEALRLPREFSDAGTTVNRAPQQRRMSGQPTVREVVQQNAATFTDIVRPQPFMPNGQLKGYRVYPGRNRQQFAAFGLRPGDLVTEVNGIALNNPAQGMEIFRSLGGSTQVTLTLERNGQSQVVTLDTNQLTTANGTR
ncbi:MAG: type II secretion system protein GspC [Gammaproteobacteria bacterium]|nr:type II secretion system protein GspC [Gammaproteobacteria bacterium]